MLKYCISTFLLAVAVNTALGQSDCELNGVKGQFPSTAILICNSTLFTQDTVPDCLNYPIPAPGCRLVGVGDYKDKNPFWFTFTCYRAGTLEFLIDPKKPDDDYNWQFYDITGHGASEIYSDGALVRGANWSGSPGKTGASASGINFKECASAPGDNVPAFSTPPDLIEGHTYLLLVSHFYDNTESGFTLSFKGGSANITDPATPLLVNASVNCDGTQLGVKLTKKMRCSTIAPDGSDFEIPGFNNIIGGAAGNECSLRYDTDSVIITLKNPLPPGNYTVAIKKGSDNNTIVDNCGNDIKEGSFAVFDVAVKKPVALDSITTPTCAPVILQLVFERTIQCSSVAPGGSDFKITGPQPVTIVAAKGNCTNGISNVIEVQLASPIVQQGTYTVTLLKGIDGNAITDPCGLETPAGATTTFTIKDTVNANFTYNIFKGCRNDTIQYFNGLENGKTNWNWQFDNGTSNSQNPTVVYNSFGNKKTQLIVSNGFCSDTAMVIFFLEHDSLKAAFTMPSEHCPDELAYFTDISTGNINNWNWQFGNGSTSNLQNPLPQMYAAINTNQLLPVQLIIQNDKACYDTAIQFLKLVSNCFVAVPKAFTPNNDGLNDYLYPLNAFRTTKLEFTIFNRNGELLFSTKDWTNKWDGSFKNQPQPTGTYTWQLQYTSTETGKTIFQKGTSVLIR